MDEVESGEGARPAAVVSERRVTAGRRGIREGRPNYEARREESRRDGDSKMMGGRSGPQGRDFGGRGYGGEVDRGQGGRQRGDRSEWYSHEGGHGRRGDMGPRGSGGWRGEREVGAHSRGAIEGRDGRYQQSHYGSQYDRQNEDSYRRRRRDDDVGGGRLLHQNHHRGDIPRDGDVGERHHADSRGSYDIRAHHYDRKSDRHRQHHREDQRSGWRNYRHQGERSRSLSPPAPRGRRFSEDGLGKVGESRLEVNEAGQEGGDGVGRAVESKRHQEVDSAGRRGVEDVREIVGGDNCQEVKSEDGEDGGRRRWIDSPAVEGRKKRRTGSDGDSGTGASAGAVVGVKVKTEIKEEDGRRRDGVSVDTTGLTDVREVKDEKDDKKVVRKSRIGEQKMEGVGEAADGDYEEGEEEEEVEAERPNFETTGLLAAETNMRNGVVLKHAIPPEGRTPDKKWRLYMFKADDQTKILHIHRQSCFVVGKDVRVADMLLMHPTISKQHAVIQYRLRKNGEEICPYLMDLESTNGTFLNGERVEPKRYYELREKDLLRFGRSSREFLLLHTLSEDGNDDEEDEDDYVGPRMM